MTHAKRNAEILKIIEIQTQLALASRATARRALIKEGIYTQKGELRAKFGGGKKAVAAAD